MRGFAFSIDMVFGALLVILLVSLFSQTLHPSIVDSYTPLQIRAKDAAMEWFYSHPDAQINPSIPPGTPHACSIGFRPRVDSTAVLSPSDSSDWVFQTECVTAP